MQTDKKMGNSKYKTSAPSTFYHLYNRGNNKQNIFRGDADHRFYLKRLKEALEKHNFALICYCLMPNHVHLVVKQLSEDSPARFIASLHTSYSMVFNKKYELVGHLFQDRYKQKIIETDEYMKCLIAYIHLNPVAAGLCKLPKEYKWSSYLEYAIPGQNSLCSQELVAGYGLKGLSFEQFVEHARKIDPTDAFDE